MGVAWAWLRERVSPAAGWLSFVTFVLTTLAVAVGRNEKPAAVRPVRTFPAVEIAKIAAGHWPRPRATVTGSVSYVNHEADGDWHVKVEDGDGHFVVCEINPEFPLPHPKAGDRVKVRGIVRRDGEHDWWEVHPVYGIEVLK